MQRNWTKSVNSRISWLRLDCGEKFHAQYSGCDHASLITNQDATGRNGCA